MKSKFYIALGLSVLAMLILFSVFASSSDNFYISYNNTGTFQKPTISNFDNNAITISGTGYDHNASSILYKAYFRNNSNTAGAVRFEKDGYFFTYDLSGGQLLWKSQPGQPAASSTLGGAVSSNSQDTQVVIKNNTAVYPGAFSNTNVSYFLSGDMLKETFILSSLPSIKPYDYLEYSGNVKFNSTLKICANNQCYTPSGTQDNFNTSGQIDFKDSNNITRFYLKAPIITDSAGNSTTGIYVVHGSNAQMGFDLRIPTSFIQSAVFPIFIDPTVVSVGQSRVEFVGGLYNMSATLYKNISGTFQISPNTIFINQTSKSNLFGAVDTNSSGWEQYKYVIAINNASAPVSQKGYKFVIGTRPNSYVLDFSDICSNATTKSKNVTSTVNTPFNYTRKVLARNVTATPYNTTITNSSGNFTLTFINYTTVLYNKTVTLTNYTHTNSTRILNATSGVCNLSISTDAQNKYITATFFSTGIIDPQIYNSSSTTIFDCGNITEAGSYTVNQSFGSGGACILVQADNVTINGTGKTITGDIDASNPIGAAATNLSIFNLTVVGNISSKGGDVDSAGSGDLATGYPGGNINITYSNITGKINSTGGQIYNPNPFVNLVGGDSGTINISNSDIVSVATIGGNATGDTNSFGETYTAGASGAITITSSNITGTINSVGGYGDAGSLTSDIGVGGNSGAITITSSKSTSSITNIGGSAVSDGGGFATAGTTASTTLTSSNITGTISSKGGAAGNNQACFGCATPGASGAITITSSNTSGIVSISGNGASFTTLGSPTGAITITSSKVFGSISSTSQQAEYGVGADTGAITITSSNITGTISSKGGDAVDAASSGGSTGVITVNSSTTQYVSALSGTSNGFISNICGTTGNIIIFNSTTGNVTSYVQGTSLDGCGGGSPGNITITNSSTALVTNHVGGGSDSSNVLPGNIIITNSNTTSISSTAGSILSNPVTTRGGNSSAIIITSSKIVGTITSTAGDVTGSGSNDVYAGASGAITITSSNITGTININSGGADTGTVAAQSSFGMQQGNITITNSVINNFANGGGINFANGGTAYGDPLGNITITNSTTGTITSTGAQVGSDFGGTGYPGNSSIITITNSTTGTITSTGGAYYIDSGLGLAGSANLITITNSTTGTITSTGADNDAHPGTTNLITITNSTTSGILNQGGNVVDSGGLYEGNGADTGAITITSSNITGTVTSNGGQGRWTSVAGFGGNSGAISIVQSTVQAINSTGGQGQNNIAGTSSTITITSSNITGTVTSNGGIADITAGASGAITITSSNITNLTSHGGSVTSIVANNIGGGSGNIDLTSSSFVFINSTGGLGYDDAGTYPIGGNGGGVGAITITSSNGGIVNTVGGYGGGFGNGSAGGIITSTNSTVGSISSIGGGSDSAFSGNGGNVTLITSKFNISSSTITLSPGAGGGGSGVAGLLKLNQTSLLNSLGSINYSFVGFTGNYIFPAIMNITQNLATVDSVTYPEYNVSSNVTLENVTFLSPHVLRDGVTCTSSFCTNLAYSSVNKRGTFLVSSFTNYSLAEDTTNPNGTLLTPANASTVNNANVNFSANLTDDTNLSVGQLNIINSTGSTINQTNVTATGIQQVVSAVVNLIDGFYTWFFRIWDFAGNIADTQNFTVTVDTTQISACPFNASVTHGNYTLSQNLTSTGTCITVSAEDVTINGAGYKITGDTTGYGINSSSDTIGWTVTVKNLTINNFSTDIYGVGGTDFNSFLSYRGSNYTISDSNFTTINVTGGNGGGDYCGNPGGKVNISRSNVTNLVADGGGGALCGNQAIMAGGQVTVVNSTITNLYSRGGYGIGAPSISGKGGSVEVNGSTISVLNASGGVNLLDVGGNGGTVTAYSSSITTIDARGAPLAAGSGGSGGTGGTITLTETNSTNMYVQAGNTFDFIIEPKNGGTITINNANLNLTNAVLNLTNGIHVGGGSVSGATVGAPGNLVLNYSNSFIDTNSNYGLNLTLQIYNNSKSQVKWFDILNGANLNGKLSTNSTLKFNFTSVDSVSTSELNKSANITFYGMTGGFSAPAILKNGVICSDCYNFTSLNAATVIFNVSSFSNYTIAEGVTPDTNPPQYSNVVVSPASPQNWSSSLNPIFNITWTDDINFTTANFTWNGVNLTMTNLSGVYSINFTGLSVGTYPYTFWGFDSSGNVNSTSGTYIINQSASITTLRLNNTAGNLVLTYPQQINASASCDYGTLTLYRNGSNVNTENNVFVSLTPNYYTYQAVCVADSNHTNSLVNYTLTLNKGTGVVFAYINNSRANFTAANSTVYLNATLQTGTGNINLWFNNTKINTGASPLSNLTSLNVTGTYPVTAEYLGNTNYTASNETWYWIVDTSAPVITIVSPTVGQNFNVPTNSIYNLLVNFSVTDSNLSRCFYTINNGITNNSISCSNGYNTFVLNLTQGGYNLTVYANDTQSNLGRASTKFSVTYVDSGQPGGSGGYNPSSGGSGVNGTTYYCNVSYLYIQKYGLNDFTDMAKFINETNSNITTTTLQDYVLSWQPRCSDVINRTLEENYVCTQIYYFLVANNNNYTMQNVDTLRSAMYSTIKVSNSLILNYAQNYPEKCEYITHLRLPFNIKKNLSVTNLPNLQFPSCTPELNNALFDAGFGTPIAINQANPVYIGQLSCNTLNLLRWIFKINQESGGGYSLVGWKFWWIILLAIILVIVYMRKRNKGKQRASNEQHIHHYNHNM